MLYRSYSGVIAVIMMLLLFNGCYIGVILLNWFYTGVILLLYWCHIGVILVLY